MKVLYIDINCKGSSTGQIVYSLFSNCKKNGIEAAVCYGRGPLIKEEGIYKFGLDLETSLHALLTRLTGYMGRYSFFSTRKLIKYIKAFKPDVVHIHELHAYFVNIKTLLLYLKNNGIKTIITNHCEFLYTGKCGQAKECLRFLDSCGNCPLKKEYPKSLFLDKTKQMFLEKKKIFDGWKDLYLVTPSMWLKTRIEMSFLKDKRVSVVHNGIDTGIYKVTIDDSVKTKYRIPSDKKIIISVAPNIFSEQKGGYRFLDIARAFETEETMIFVAVGAIDKPDNIPSNVIVVPLIQDKEELVKLYSASDCMVICSTCETFPTTSIEAQCCGTKVVAYDAGGTKETILSNNGLVVPFGDLDKTVEAIQSIINNPYKKDDISKIAFNEYSEESMFKNYLNIYKELL